MTTSTFSPSVVPDNTNLNGTRPLDPSPSAAALFGMDAALKVEGLRALFNEKPLKPTRPGHVKAFKNPDDVTEDKWGNETCHSEVVESRMVAADQLLSLVHRASAGAFPTQFHTTFDTQLNAVAVPAAAAAAAVGSDSKTTATTTTTTTVSFEDKVVPLDNIVRPVSETIFPILEANDGTRGKERGKPNGHETTYAAEAAGSASSSNSSPVLLRHAAQIPPSAGHIEGDFSLRTHDSSVPALQQTDAQSPQRLRVARTDPIELEQDSRINGRSSSDDDGEGENDQKDGEAAAKQQLMLLDGVSPARSSTADGSGNNSPRRGVVSNIHLCNKHPSGIKDVERRHRREQEQQLGQEERAMLLCRREAHKHRPRPALYRWKLSTVRASGGSHGIIAFVGAPISATAVHRCSVQILAHANSSSSAGAEAVPPGTTALANGVFDRPTAAFGLTNRSVLLAPGTVGAKPESWNALCWKSSGTLPAAAMMSAVSASGKPALELPKFGRNRDDEEHYVRVGDVLTIETRPIPQTPSGSSATSSNTFAGLYLGGGGAGGPASEKKLPGVSCSFYINNVLIHSYDNLARLQPYSRAATATTALTALPHPSQVAATAGEQGSVDKKLQELTSQGLERSPFHVDFMNFALRLWPGQEVAIVSGDTSRIVGPVTK